MLSGVEINRRLLLTAIALFIISLLMLWASSQQLTTNLLTSNYTSGSMALTNRSVGYLQVQLNTTDFFDVGFQSASPVNFYLLNSTALSAVGQSINNSNTIMGAIVGNESKGALTIVLNSTRAVFPYDPSYNGTFTRPEPNSGTYNNSIFVPGGTYYLVFQNLNNHNNTALYYYYLRPESAFAFIPTAVSPLSIISTLFFIASILLGLYSLVAKAPERAARQETVREDEIEELYKGMEKKRSKRGAARKKKEKKRGRLKVRSVRTPQF